jgi:hypothetical protein
MKCPSRPLAAAAWLLAALPAGCAHAPSPTPVPDPEAGEQIRRAERLRIMQEYWSDQTVSAARPPSPSDPATLDYPAGTYDGINFAPRTAPDPSLREPSR